jgi:hypothetical protein
MKSYLKVVAVLAAVVVVAGCSSPQGRIRKVCIAESGLSSGGVATAPEVVDRQCTCFADRLKASLTSEQLEKVAKVMEAPKAQREEAARAGLDPVTFPLVLGAAKACAAPGQ